jgi:hypothetical protein
MAGPAPDPPPGPPRGHPRDQPGPLRSPLGSRRRKRVPSSTCLLTPFTHALAVFPVPVPPSTCLLLSLCCHLDSRPSSFLGLGWASRPSCRSHSCTRQGLPARTALSSLTEVRAFRRAAFGQVKHNQLLAPGGACAAPLGSRSPAQGPSH